MGRRSAFVIASPLVVVLALVAGCAAQEAVPETAAKGKGAASSAPSVSAAASAPAAAPGHLARGEVERVLRQGPPWILRRVVPEEVIRGGKFIGWRILSMPGDWEVGLKSGDIVTKVNGLSIERPDDLWAAWMQLQSAPELRISYERDGKLTDMVMPIDGASTAKVLPDDTQPPPGPASTSRWQTKVIEGEESSPAPDPISE